MIFFFGFKAHTQDNLDCVYGIRAVKNEWWNGGGVESQGGGVGFQIFTVVESAGVQSKILAQMAVVIILTTVQTTSSW